ncbi:MAG: AtpZ/AtpI family protein [Patescibacteria group bacterium]
MLQYNNKNIPAMNEDFEIGLSKKSKKTIQKPQDLGYLKYLNIGFYLVTPLLFGVLAGAYADGRLHSKPIGVTIGIIIGSVGTFYNLIKLVK